MNSIIVKKIKNHLALNVLISRYIKLKSHGENEYIGLCPFHQEKTPSFTVNNLKDFYHCFGCNAHGDIFTFVMHYNKISYKEVVEIFSKEFNLTSNLTFSNNNLNIFYSIYNIASAFYHNYLLHRSDAQFALKYLKNRGLTDTIIDKYQLGYVSYEIEELLSHMRKFFTIEDILSSGIIKSKNHFYNPLVNRVIFPISDSSNKVIAFGGRIIFEKHNPKYLNSSDSPIFKKRYTLYNINIAKDYCKDITNIPSSINNTIILVEGYMDVLLLARYQIYNVVASLGTAVQTEQIQLLWQNTNHIVVCLDADFAGKKAMIKIAELVLSCLKLNKFISFLSITNAKDIGELVYKFTDTELIKQLKNISTLADFLFLSYLNESNTDTVEGRAELHQKIMQAVFKIPNLSLRYEYKNYLLTLYNKHLNLNKYSKNTDDINNQMSLAKLNNDDCKAPQILKYLLHFFLKFPHVLDNNLFYEELVRIEIKDNKLDQLRNYITCINKEDYTDSAFAILLNSVKNSNFNTSNLPSDIDNLTKIAKLSFELYSLSLLQDEILSVQKEIENSNNEQNSVIMYSRLLGLKKYELEIKRQLKVI